VDDLDGGLDSQTFTVTVNAVQVPFRVYLPILYK
jgi:hypothetical protein